MPEGLQLVGGASATAKLISVFEKGDKTWVSVSCTFQGILMGETDKGSGSSMFGLKGTLRYDAVLGDSGTAALVKLDAEMDAQMPFDMGKFAVHLKAKIKGTL